MRSLQQSIVSLCESRTRWILTLHGENRSRTFISGVVSGIKPILARSGVSGWRLLNAIAFAPVLEWLVWLKISLYDSISLHEFMTPATTPCGSRYLTTLSGRVIRWRFRIIRYCLKPDK